MIDNPNEQEFKEMIEILREMLKEKNIPYYNDPYPEHVEENKE